MEGRIRAALRLLTNKTQTSLLSLDEVLYDNPTSPTVKTVRDILEEKHLDANPTHADAILSGSNEDNFHPIVFKIITADAIRKCALQTEGAADSSGVDAVNWRRFCTYCFCQRVQ